MAEAATKVPVRSEKRPSMLEPWRPFESLRSELDRMFEDFDRGFWRLPFRRPRFEIEPLGRGELAWGAAPAVDIVEKDKAYELTAELPGLDESNVEIKIQNGMLVIKGEKAEEKEEERKDYYLSERRYGSFERRFPVPEGVDIDKIDARFKNGVLTMTLPKTPEAQKMEKKITVKAG